MKTAKTTETYVREIRVRTLFLHVLRSWRLIVIAALVFCVLGAGGQYYRLHRAAAGVNGEQEREQYQQELDAYETDREAYKKTIKKIKEDLQSKREYLNTSILAEIDPNAEAIAQVTVTVVSAGEKSEKSIIADYKRMVENGIDWSALAERMDIESRFLQELVSVTAAANSLDIQVRHTDTERAREILEEILRQVSTWQEMLSEDGGAHAVTTSQINVQTVADSAMFTWLNKRLDELNKLQTNLTKTQNAANKLEKPTVPTSVSSRSILKSVGKYAVAGLVGGALLVVIVCALILAMRNKVLDAEELEQVFALRHLLSVQAASKRATRIDRWIAHRGGDQDLMQTAEICEKMLSINLEQFAGDKEQLLLMGDVNAEELSRAAEMFARVGGERVYRVADSSDPLALRAALEDAEGLVLVTQVGTSNYDRIAHLVRLAGDWDREIIGSVCIY